MNLFSPRSGNAGRVIQLLGCMFVLLVLCVPAFSQGGFGRITGLVTDQSGGVIAGATVTIIDKDRGVARTLTTDDAGEYNAPNLTPSTYVIRVEAKGFERLERQNVDVGVGKEVRVDLTPIPGTTSQTVTVTESIPLVETTNATLGGTLNNSDINDMPLNGRNYQNLLSLRPGIAVYPGGGPWSQSTNNIRPDESGWMVDGVINANFYDARPLTNMPSPYTDGATILPVDAIQEFNLQENPKAEYGWKPGAVVNVGIRSGTNTIHGSMYGFYRSSNWDARALFNPTTGNCAQQAPDFCSQSPGQLKQFGAVIGGPIKKDKLFYFLGYEGLRSFVGQKLASGGSPEMVHQLANPNPITCPAGQTGDCASSMIDALIALQNAGNPISQISMKLACPNLIGVTVKITDVCLGYNSPNGGLWPANNSQSSQYPSALPNTNISDNGVAKINYNINSKHTINGLVLVSDYTGDGIDHPVLNPTMKATWLGTPRTVGAGWVWTPNSTLVNDARFAYNQYYAPFVIDDGTKQADGTGYPVNSGLPTGGLPNLYIGSLAAMGAWHNRPGSSASHYFDLQDSVSYLMGKHTWKFGVEYAHLGADVVVHDNARGRLDFDTIQTFLAGIPSGGRYFVGDAKRSLLWNSWAGFVQDDWRMSQKVTLNLGLRYSYTQPIKEIHNQLGNFDPAAVSTGGLVQPGLPGAPPTLYKPDHKNFSPRVGFAWDLTGRGTTVVRGGASVIYSTFMAAYFLAQNGLQNSGATSTLADPTGACRTKVNPGGSCPAGGTYGGTITTAAVKVSAGSLCWDPALAGCAAGQTTVFPAGAVTACFAPTRRCNIMAVDPNLLTPFVTGWNLGVTHAFTNNLSLEVGYVGTHGSRLTGFRDLNQFVNSTRPYGTTFPELGFINKVSNDGRSNYHSLQTTLTERTSHGLSFTAGYTYGHGLDTGSLNRMGFLPADSTHPEREYASGDFDMRHRFTLTASYEIPGIKGFAQMLEGWKLNTIVSLQTSQPWDVSEGTSAANPFNFSGNNDNNDRWDFFGNPADFRSGAISFMHCSGPASGGCSQISGISGATLCNGAIGGGPSGSCDAATSAALWAKCTAVAPNAGSLGLGGCYVSGNSIITPPVPGQFGTMGRNIFRDSGFKNVDFSVFKTFRYKERYSAQFRVELFNLFNHPNIANPYGSVNGSAVGNDPANPITFGCGCATADIAGGSPFVSSGTPRAMQLGLKLMF